MYNLFYPKIVIEAVQDTSGLLWHKTGLDKSFYHHSDEINNKILGANPQDPVCLAFNITELYLVLASGKLRHPWEVNTEEKIKFITPIERLGQIAYDSLKYPQILWQCEMVRACAVQRKCWKRLKELL